MPEINRGGFTLHYETQGQGASLVLVAGIASDSSSWGPLVAPLSRDFQLLRPDNRASGQSLPKLPEVSIEASAQDLAALIETVGGPAHLVGHSMGGLIALELAAARPDLVQSLTLLASAPLRSGRNQHLLDVLSTLRAPGMDPRLWLRAFYPWLLRAAIFQVPGLVEVALRAAMAYPYAQSPEQFAAQVAAVGAYDPVPRAAVVHCPVQAVLGTDDLLYPVSEARTALEAAFPGLKITEVKGAAHSLHWDQPEAVAEAILSFVSG